MLPIQSIEGHMAIERTAHDKGLRFPGTKKFLSSLDHIIQLNTFLVFGASLVVLYHFQHQFGEIRAFMLASSWGVAFYYFTLCVLTFKAGFLLFLLYNYLRYRPVEPASDEALPHCTVIVPAFNEGSFVYKTLESILASDYPMEKLQVIAIDDGSSDDTWEWIQKAQAQWGNLVTAHKQARNMGKRHALYRGFKEGRGSVFVTIDSDSIVQPGTIRSLVSPFVTDPKCGAVAGNVRILNNRNTMIPKMLNVSFAFSFGLIRAAQSRLDTVICTPGALSAYRRDAVMHCLEEWIEQTFLGVKTDIGEDRAMTNMILKQGYNTKFQRTALVFTNVPETYRNLRRMFTRWERSNVRENVMMSKYAFSRFREGTRIPARILLVNQWLTILTAYPSLVVMVGIIAVYPRLFISSTIVSVFLFSLIPALYYSIRHNARGSLWIFTYNLFYSFALFWITPYAILTARRRGWLTRG